MDNPEEVDSGETPNEAGGESQKPEARPVTLEKLAEALAAGPESDVDAQSEATEPGETQAPAEGGEPGETQAPPKTLAEVAERLGLDVAELYNLEIPDAHREGETHTLGALKNSVDEQSQFAVDQLAWESTRQEQQAQLSEAREELEELMRHIPPSALKPEAMEAIKKRLDRRAAKERQLTVGVIPEWKDSDRATSDLQQMVEYMQAEGFGPKYLGTVKDHKLMRFIRKSWLLQKRVDHALSLVTKKPTTSGKTANAGPRQPQPASKPAARTPNAKRSKLVELMQPTEG